MSSSETHQCIAEDVRLGRDVKISKFVNLYGCAIGDNTKIGSFVEIQRGATVGKNAKISSHTFLCEGVHVDDGCFIGHGVMFINDKTPRSTTPEGRLEGAEDWRDRFVETYVGKGASIGTNATIMGGIRIGDGAMIGAGSVVLRDVPAREVWAGNPARKIRSV